MFYSYIDSYANPIIGSRITVSGGYGANVSGTTDGNGYYTLAVKPTNIGGPFALSFAVTSSSGNYNTIQGNITVTAPIVVPVQDVLAGVTIAGQTGSMPNMVTANPNGMGVGRSAALQYLTGGGSTVYLKPQQGYYDGTDTWTYYNDPNLVPGNIKSGTSILGVAGTFAGVVPTHGSQSWTTPGTYTWTVPSGVNSVMGIATGGGGGGFDYNYSNYVASGGGGGGTNLNMINVTPGQVLTITVGLGGTARGFGQSADPGGASSIDSFSAGGGNAGTYYYIYQGGALGGTGGGYGGYGGTGGLSSSSITPAYGGAGMSGYGNGGTAYYGGTLPTNGSSGRVVISW